jgi:hypothetical protein
MADGLTIDGLDNLATFVRELEALSARTGITVGAYGPVPLVIEAGAGSNDGGTNWEIGAYRNGDGLIGYVFNAQR